MSEPAYYPMIPPSCPYFPGDGTFKTLRSYHGQSEQIYHLAESELDRGAPPVEWIPIIASTARCYWLDAMMPSDSDFKEQSPPSNDYLSWLIDRSNNFDEFNGVHQICRFTWNGYREQRAINWRVWAMKKIKGEY